MMTARKSAALLLMSVLAASCSKRDKTTDVVESTELPKAAPLIGDELFSAGLASGSAEGVEVRLRTKLAEKLGSGVANEDALKEIWRSEWREEWNGPLAESSRDNLRLPESFSSLVANVSQGGALDPSVLQKVVKTAEDQEGLYALWALSKAAVFSSGNDLPAILRDRATSLPIARGDLLTYLAVTNALRGMQRNGHDFPTLNAWQELATAPNPVYRLIALKASVYTLPAEHGNYSSEDPEGNKVASEGRVRYCRQFLYESDKTIISELVDVLRQIGGEAAASLLEEVRQQQLAVGSQDLADRALRAIEDVDDRRLIEATLNQTQP